MEPNKVQQRKPITEQEKCKSKAKFEDKNKTLGKRTKWGATEKKFLFLCRDKAIAKMLDTCTCLTTACLSIILGFFRTIPKRQSCEK